MCGRLVISSPAQQLAAAFDAELHPTTQGLRPSWNVAPTRLVPALMLHGGGRLLVAAHWRLRAPWIRIRQATTTAHQRSRTRLVAYYCLADLMLVTPLKDGMNIVAKEFVVSQDAIGGHAVLGVPPVFRNVLV